jgi:multimeric flavodoxin WrbA
MKKIIGLSCGRKNGNCETLLKAAAMGAEEFGVETEIIRALSLRVMPCKACGGCFETHKCVLKDDVDWILEKTLLEDCGLIVAAPVYHIRSNACLVAINERMNHMVDYNNLDVLLKIPGAVISVGGGMADWTSMGLITATPFVMHSRLLVDQMQVTEAGMLGTVLTDFHKKTIEQAKQLGRNVAKAMMIPPEERKYMGEESDVSCPYCYCNVLQVPEKLPHVVCPVCWIHGVISVDGGKMKVKWDEESVKHARFSPRGIPEHGDYIAEHQKKEKAALEQDSVKELIKKYRAYGKIIKPVKS